MPSNIRNLIIGAVVVVVIAAGAAVGLSGGDDDNDGQEVATTPAEGEDEATDGSDDGSGGSSSGGSSSGGSSSGGSSGGDQGGGQDQDDDGNGGGGQATTTTAAQTAPVVNLLDQRCSGGKLIAGVTANASSSAYRKGVKSVKMERQNDEDAYLSFTGQWLGPETGNGDVWNATLNYGTNFGKTLRVVATSDSNQSTTKEYPITVPC